MPTVLTLPSYSTLPLDTVAPAGVSSARFTLDGAPGLEAHLADICRQVRAGIEHLVPPRRLEGILLGGGYGRGEGGVLSAATGDEPYNDLEFYVLLRGSILLNERRYRAGLARLAHALSEAAGIEVEFKVLSRARLRHGPVTMFSYDLIHGHRRICGPADLLRDCSHHRLAAHIPLAEATRLLFNRCSGLLFARERLARTPFTPADADFVERNLAKVRLALGDVILAAGGQYHWSCRERHCRLLGMAVSDAPCLATITAEHERAVQFKLHPHRSTRGVVELYADLRQLSSLACRVWLWLESRRLGTAFRTPGEYAAHPAPKCPETSAARNWLVTLRHLGWRAAWRRSALRYPRERLFRALPVLLWQPTLLGHPRVRLQLQRDLATSARTEAAMMPAYTRIWEIFR